jgi:hypothetical protein
MNPQTALDPKEFAALMKIGIKQARRMFYETDTDKTTRVGRRRRMPWAVYRKHYAKEA